VAADPQALSRKRLPIAAAALLCGGCAMVGARGVVRNAAGAEIENATIQIATASGTPSVLDAQQTTPNGCFTFSDVAPRHEKRFTLDISAPGYKPAHLDLGADKVTLLVTLAPDSAEQASELHPMTYDQTVGIYEPLCVTFVSHGASTLGPT
jgi:hypothetical protein